MRQLVLAVVEALVEVVALSAWARACSALRLVSALARRVAVRCLIVVLGEQEEKWRSEVGMLGSMIASGDCFSSWGLLVLGCRRCV